MGGRIFRMEGGLPAQEARGRCPERDPTARVLGDPGEPLNAPARVVCFFRPAARGSKKHTKRGLWGVLEKGPAQLLVFHSNKP